MLEIDAHHGGQVLRIGVALSAILQKPVKFVNIRKNRPNPGLRSQHIAAIKSVAKLSDASVSGLEVGSMELVFEPGTLKKRRVKVHIPTAGAATLVVQSFSLASILQGGSLEVTGGTDVPFAPPADYLKFFLFPLLNSAFRLNFELEVIDRGYYPVGGGKLIFSSRPTKITEIKPSIIETIALQPLVVGSSYNLPGVARRMVNTAVKLLLSKGFYPKHLVDERKGDRRKIGCTLVLGLPGATFDMLGKKGLRAEEIGRRLAERFLRWDKEVLDPHTSDQVLPYLALFGGKARITFTDHVMALLKLFKTFGINYKVKQNTVFFAGIIKEIL